MATFITVLLLLQVVKLVRLSSVRSASLKTLHNTLPVLWCRQPDVMPEQGISRHLLTVCDRVFWGLNNRFVCVHIFSHMHVYTCIHMLYLQGSVTATKTPPM